MLYNNIFTSRPAHLILYCIIKKILRLTPENFRSIYHFFFGLQKTLSYNNASIDLVIESRKTLSSRSFVSLLDHRKLFFKTNLFIYKLSSLTDVRSHSSPSFRDWGKTRKILSKEIFQKPALSNKQQHISKPIIYLLDQGKAVFWIQHVLKLSVTGFLVYCATHFEFIYRWDIRGGVYVTML